MENVFFVFIANFCQLLIVPISIYAYLPQWKDLIKNGTSRNISLKTYNLWSFCSCLAVVYSFIQYKINGSGLVLVATSCLNLFCMLISTGLILIYMPESKENYFNNNGKLRLLLTAFIPKILEIQETKKIN